MQNSSSYTRNSPENELDELLFYYVNTESNIIYVKSIIYILYPYIQLLDSIANKHYVDSLQLTDILHKYPLLCKINKSIKSELLICVNEALSELRIVSRTNIDKSLSIIFMNILDKKIQETLEKIYREQNEYRIT